MKRVSFNSFLFVFLLLICLPACQRPEGNEETESTLTTDQTIDFDSSLYIKADSIMRSLTLEERVGECFMPSVFSKGDLATLNLVGSYIADCHVGGLLLLKGDIESVVLIEQECRRSVIPLFLAIDAEWGLAMRLKDAPEFPKNGDIKAEETLLFDYGREVARECRRIGINMVLGPVMDVTSSRSGIIGKRSFGSEPKRVAELATAYAKGLESGGVLSVAKHFPGHGATTTDSHQRAGRINKDRHHLDSVDLFPFKEYVSRGLSGVMVGHLIVEAWDSTGTPAAVSSKIIGGVLRKQLGFRGLVFTDALDMGGATGFTALDALKAGADIVISPLDVKKEIRDVMDALRSGKADPEMIDEKCRRIIYYKEWLGLRFKETVELDGLQEDIENPSTDSLKIKLRS